jgi:hypothetical protein
MRKLIAGICLLLTVTTGQATERWKFSTRVAVTDSPVKGIFHHLEGAGRKHIAVSAQTVAVTWEDNRHGVPQVFIAIKGFTDKQFSDAMQVSDGVEAYEPAIANLPDNRFVLVWEQDQSVFARSYSRHGFSKPIRLNSHQAANPTIATFGREMFSAWREQTEQGWFLQVAHLELTQNNQLRIVSSVSVEQEGLATQVLYPSLAVNSAGVCVAWEDRRAGHTRLLFAYSTDEGRTFGEPQHLNEFLSNRNQYDQGSGVTRVSLASFASDEVLAAWMDKRLGAHGYGIFAALGVEGGAEFWPNERVHSEGSDQLPHNNPAVAGNSEGQFVVTWDDFRLGDSDVWISSYNDDEEWSLDHSPAVASGKGEQTHPSIVLDEEGSLHLLWVERSDFNAPSRLYYSLGQQ